MGQVALRSRAPAWPTAPADGCSKSLAVRCGLCYRMDANDGGDDAADQLSPCSAVSSDGPQQRSGSMALDAAGARLPRRLACVRGVSATRELVLAGWN